MSCEHRRTHPSSCDDCGEPWCGVCVTYHRAGTVFECASKLRARVAELESELVTWKGIAKERGDRLAGDRAPPSVSVDRCEDAGDGTCTQDHQMSETRCTIKTSGAVEGLVPGRKGEIPKPPLATIPRRPGEPEEADTFPLRTCRLCGATTRSTSVIDLCLKCGDEDGLRPKHFLTRDKAGPRTSEALPGERERCARHCEVIANFVETGAGPIASPGARLRQAAENIRSGRPATLWLPEHQADPDYWIPTPKCGHGAQAFTFACDECGALPDGAKVHHPCPTEARDPAECNGSGVYSGICSRGKRGCNTLHPEAPRTDYPRKEKQMLSNESVLEWAASWVPDEPPGQRARFVEGLRRELECRPETARHDVKEPAVHAYCTYRRAMHKAFPDEYPDDFEPWTELGLLEQGAWALVASALTGKEVSLETGSTDR